MTDESKALNAAVATIAITLLSYLVNADGKKEIAWGKLLVGGVLYLWFLSLAVGYNAKLVSQFSILVLVGAALSQSPKFYKAIGGAI